MNTNKEKAVAAAMAAVEKQHGKGAIMRMGDRVAEQVPAIPSGSPSIDAALGCGGYPRGRIVEIYGPESSGKTTLTLHALAECQKRDGVTAFVDAEHALDVQYAKALGVDPARLLVSQPDTGEQALDIVETLVQSAAVDLIVVDSVAALVPKAEIEGDMGDSHMGLQARLMSQAMRKLTALCSRTGTCLIFINQLRMKIGVMFGSPETTTGGQALKYYSSVRLDVRRIGAIKVGEDTVGNRTRVKVVKNKLAPPFQQAEFDIRYGHGIDFHADLLELALAREVVEKSGNHHTFRGESFGNGRDKARQALIDDPKLRAAIEQALAATSNAVFAGPTPSPAPGLAHARPSNGPSLPAAARA